MIPLSSLWLPILLAAVLVFIVSSVTHMVLKYHNADYRRLPNEDEVREALLKGAPAPGQYVLPHCLGPEQMKDPAVQKKFLDGPVALLWIKAPGLPALGQALGGWLAYLLVISIFTAYVASRTLAPDTPYLQVFRVAGAVSFLAYAGAAASGSIWMGKPWRVTLLEILDGFLFSLATAGSFAGFWPR